MSFTYDLTNAVGEVRLLIPDRTQTDAFFSDEEVQTFLDMEEQNTFLAAALALDTIASDEAMVLKVITMLDLSTNGPAVAKSLRERADSLRSRVYDDDCSIAIASMAVNEQATMDILIKDVLG